MRPLLNINYDEFIAAEQIAKKLKNNYAISFPASAQQKGFDFIITNIKNNKSLKVQVKASRSYQFKLTEMKSKKRLGNYTSFFTKFPYKKKLADLYIFVIHYPIINKKKRIWSTLCLAFFDKDVNEFLKGLVKKRGGPERFFYIEFDTNNTEIIYLTRGSLKPQPLKEHLLPKQIFDIIRKLT
jgi:hypothetical protein